MQQRLLQQFTQKMSDEWNVVFRIDSMDMQSWSKVALHGFYLEDPDRDTLLQVDHINIDGWSIKELLSRQIHAEKVTLRNAVFKLQRAPERRYFSLDYIIDYFNEEDPLPVEERFKINIDTALIDTVRYRYSDATAGVVMDVWAPVVYAAADSVNLIGKWVRLDTTYVDQAKVSIQTTDPVTIPDSVPPSPYNTLPDEEVPPWSIRCTRLALKELTYRSSESFSKQAEHYQAVRQDKKGRGEQPERLRRLGKPMPDKTLAEKNQDIRAHNHRENSDLNNLHFEHIHLLLNDFSLENAHYKGNLKELSAETPDGLIVADIRTRFEVTPEKATLSHLRIHTAHSAIGNAVVLHYDNYAALGDFFEKVEVALNLEDCHFMLSDLAAFVPEINDHILAKLYKNTVINVRGTYQGKMKYFNLDNFDIELGKKDIKMDAERAKKKTPVEWLARTFGPHPKRKEERQRRRDERRAERHAKRQ